jgi:glycosyltransferase involved in cell wall biosynthesis
MVRFEQCGSTELRKVDRAFMFCTTIIPTVGRKKLARAVESVLTQDFSEDDYEVIVVNDSGSALVFEEWQTSPRVRVVNTNHRERCVARNVGAALARGTYLHFLDDDDWLLPGALKKMWKLSQTHPGGAWLYGGATLYDREDRPVIQLIHALEPNCFVQTMAGEWIPLQASLIHYEKFHQIGGFNPLIAGIEDMDVTRRMALHFNFVGTRDLIAGVELGTAGSTTNQMRARLDGRQARELILDESNVYKRLWQSAINGYWRGRIVRVYATSAVWNFLHWRPLRALSRSLYALVALLQAVLTSVFKREFWKAILGPHQSEAFSRGQQARGNRIGTLD